MSELTPSDVALLQNDGGMNGGLGFFWIFALLCLAGNGNFGFGGNNRGDYVTQGELAAQLGNQTNAMQLNSLAVETANNNYETAQLINNQTTQMLQQNNTNLINAIQGFNNLGLQITNQTNVLSQQMQSLGAQLNECCCSIKTQMLQDRLDETQTALSIARNEISNKNQTQEILSQMGRYVAWAGSGNLGAAATA